MKFKDQLLLEEAYFTVQQSQFVAWSYKNSKLKNIFSEDIWNSNSLEAKLMFVEAFSIGQQCDILEEGVLSNIGKAVLKPIQIVGKIYTSVSKPIGEFVNKYGYEKTGLKEIDEKTFNSVVSKFNQYIDKLNPQAASFIKKSLSEAQTFVKGNPIKMALLAVALTTAMSFAGAPLLSIFAAACLVRGTLGLLKGEKPIQAFGKSLITGTIGKVLGLAGREVFEYFGSGEVPETSEGESGIDFAIQNLKQLNPSETLRKFSNFESEEVESIATDDPLAKLFSKNMEEKQAKIELNQKYLNKLLKYQEQPVSLKELLSDAWKDMGMPEEQVEKFLKNSFKDKNLVNVNLDHKSRFIFVQDLIERLEKEDSKYWSILLKDFSDVTGQYVSTINVFAENFPFLKIPKLTQDSTLEEWVRVIDSFKTNEQTKTFFKELTPQMVNDLKEKINVSNGFANSGSDVYYLNKTNHMDMQFLFRQISTHEALHTGQTEVPQDLVQSIESVKEIVKNEFIDAEKARLNQIFQKYPGEYSEERINQQLAKAAIQIQKQINYYSNPKEIQTWLGMVKKTYYETTGILISNESDSSDINKFFKWLNDNAKNNNEAKNVSFIKKILDASEKTKQIFINQLKDVAANQLSKNVSNIA